MILRLFQTTQVKLHMRKKLDIKNVHEVSQISMIKINRGLGNISKNLLDSNIQEFQLLSGQYPQINKSKKSISNFHIRKNMILGISVSLRKKKKLVFLIKFLYLVLPKIKNFQGLKLKSFDNQGNFNYGLNDQLVFPEINYTFLEKNSFQGVNISFITTAHTAYQGFLFLKELRFPFKSYDNR